MTSAVTITVPMTADEARACVRADDWESLISEGIEARSLGDNAKWELGDLANRVKKAYGQNRIGEFAKAINAPVDRVKEYRTVAAFWQKSVRTALLEEPTLSYSHFRIAMRLKEMTAAVAFLECAAADAWTVEKARVEMAKVKGQPTPPLRLLDAEAVVIVPLTARTFDAPRLTFELLPGVDLLALEALTGGLHVRLVVIEVKEL